MDEVRENSESPVSDDRDGAQPPVQPAVVNQLPRWISLFLKSAIALGAVLLLLRGHYQAAIESFIIVLVTFTPVLISRFFHIRIPLEFDTIAVVFITMSLFLGEVGDFYQRFWWWDLALHASSGLLLGITGFLLVYVLNQNRKIDLHLSPLFIATFAFMFAQGLGSLWEIFEFGMDRLFGLNMQKSGLVDTMTDLMINASAALLISLLGYGYLKASGTDSFLESVIKRFVRENPAIFRKHRKR